MTPKVWWWEAPEIFRDGAYSIRRNGDDLMVVHYGEHLTTHTTLSSAKSKIENERRRDRRGLGDHDRDCRFGNGTPCDCRPHVLDDRAKADRRVTR